MRNSALSFLAPSLNGEESLKKLNNSRIWIHIPIFTKMESIRPCETPNLSTKFHPNLSTEILVPYIGLSLCLNGEESLKKLLSSDPDPDLHQYRIKIENSSLSHTQSVHNISFVSVHNFLRYPPHK